MNIRTAIDTRIRERILILDGAMGTMIQRLGLGEDDFRGALFAGHPVPLLGCNDALCLSSPGTIVSIHEAYLKAGADIVETCSFNATSVSLADYGLEDRAYDISRAAAELAKAAAGRFSADGKPRFVAGVMGPTTKSASISPDMSDPGKRGIYWDELEAAYYDNARGLLDGGADLLMVETVFDTLNAKAALFAVSRLMEERGIDIPVMVSGTVADAAGRLLSGQTVEAFCVSVLHAKPVSLGLNCSLGAEKLHPYLRELAACSPVPVSCHPNAGMPNRLGEYDETPESMAAFMGQFMAEGLVNIAGGCCGTTPEHISALAEQAEKYQPRPPREMPRRTVFAGLEPVYAEPGKGLTDIGERTNVAGSRKFLRLIKEKKYEEALEIARDMVRRGAALIDVCMDDALLDGKTEMVRFLNLALSDPDIARVPVMADSSRWEVLEAALKCLQGKSLVNSISLKEGEAEFLRKARLARRYGAGVVVMLFDEQGQAAEYERKIAVAGRSYRILTGDGFPPEDIVFDPNVLSVATGIPEHDCYGLDFIRACAWIRENCPHAQISGGISNLSFSFRGNEQVREAMHSVFLKHAMDNGLAMAIVNPAGLVPYSDLDPELRTAAEDVVLCRGTDSAEKLLALALKIKNEGDTQKGAGTPPAGDSEAWRNADPEERIVYAMVRGADTYIETDVLELRRKFPRSLDIVEGPLMRGMKEVGTRFGEGRMFLPQVIRSARVMKKAVAVLEPFIQEEKAAGDEGRSGESRKIILATVKGDVHDIGKNIVGVVLGCNGYDVLDLGVMIPSDEILDAARRENACAIGLSGLITPSLDEMVRTARAMEERGFTIPLIIGGATTSLAHTALRIAPEYSGPVVYVPDASRSAEAMHALLSETERPRFLEDLRGQYGKAAENHETISGRRELVSITEARRNRIPPETSGAPEPPVKGITQFDGYPIERVVPYIDWDGFFRFWDLNKRKNPGAAGEFNRAREDVLDDAKRLLDQISSEGLLRLTGVIGFFPAFSRNDDVVLSAYTENASGCGSAGEGPELGRFCFLRNQELKRAGSPNPCLADFILPPAEDQNSVPRDWAGLFALSAGSGLQELRERFRRENDDYQAFLAASLADRLAEAFSEEIHLRVRREFWGYAPDENLSPGEILAGKYRGIRPGFGYPACPDHHDKETVFSLLEARTRCGFDLTPAAMMVPASSVCGMYFAAPGAFYFGIGDIGEDQLLDWARRKGITPEEAKKRLGRI
ncbi:methionine synthase [Breznakiella homolactica]|uniref:Methionine synthase n=1 Tax=Breznakiella homolactica TaxID=2798577 RepID=A0A7T8BBD1_9SPIR|nr:methionine synthase [Breznakiella homolactica]QQO10281.1 methionine synthase [Breznakiella homolactica]